VLGLLLQQILHAVIEIGYIFLLGRDYLKWSVGLSWETLMFIHHLFGLTLLTLGAWWGFSRGNYWWGQIYEKKMYDKE